MPHTIILRNVCYSVKGFPLLRAVNMNVSAGDAVVIYGRSGYGKSTLLELCAGLLKPDSGEVLWDDLSTTQMSRQKLHDERLDIGYVFQLHALVSNYNIYDNIALPLRSRREYNEKDINRKVREVMEDFGLYGVDRAFPETLSIGQLKCASIARAFVTDPDMVILDEPLSGIDQHTVNGILRTITEYRKRKRFTIIVISQDMTAFDEFIPKKYIIENGKLIEQFCLQ